MTINKNDKTVTISFAEFSDIATECSLDVCHQLHDGKYILLCAILCSKIAAKLFENIEIDKKQN